MKILGFDAGIGTIVKWGAILSIVAMLSGGAVYIRHLIISNALNETKITALKAENANLQLTIQLQEKVRLLGEETLKQLEEENRIIDEKLKDLSSDLPEDSSDQAPESLKETIRRLKDRL